MLVRQGDELRHRRQVEGPHEECRHLRTGDVAVGAELVIERRVASLGHTRSAQLVDVRLEDPAIVIREIVVTAFFPGMKPVDIEELVTRQLEAQMRTLANMGLLSRFVGMVTDSRSFLSYPRHDYFRRLLCRILGEDVRRGLLPDDREALGRLVANVGFFNARDYFGFELGRAAGELAEAQRP